MSGTSLDGIDVAVIDFEGDRVSTVAHATTPYEDRVRERILAVSNTTCRTRDISRLSFEVGELYASAVRDCGVPLGTIELVGCHGQTIYHEGEGDTPNTLQIGEAAIIAERLGKTVVSNFRPRDMAAGGKGAPLVPFVDRLLFSHPSRNRVALNIGGIANITVLYPGEPVRAFDTGPGNMVIDQLMTIHTKGQQRFDHGGSVAQSASVNSGLLKELLNDAFYFQPPPRTAGREQFGAEYVKRLLSTGLPLPELIATATSLTAASIAIALEQFAPRALDIIAAGGGVHNRRIMEDLSTRAPGSNLVTTASFGIDPDAKEAIAFAILAYRTFRSLSGNLPDATGAHHPVILGDITPGSPSQ